MSGTVGDGTGTEVAADGRVEAEPAAGRGLERGIGRRRLLQSLAVAGLGAVAVGGSVYEDVLPGGPALRRALGLTGPDGTVPAVTPGPVQALDRASGARGRTVRMIVMSPPGAAASDRLPVCVALHGRGGSAQGMADMGIPQFLAAAVASGVPPFRVVAVDGGDATYWHQRTPGDDPMALLSGELPVWLKQLGLPGPSLALGVSMGGSGALQYARLRQGVDRAGQGPLRGVALLSPALFRSWSDARPVDAYQDEADWRAHEPLLHLDESLPARLGVWCGTEDPFCPAVRTLTGRATETHFPRGAHTGGFWLRVLPEAMAFLGHSA